MRDEEREAEERSIPTLLEAGTRFDGLVSFRGAVRVEGLVVGEVVAEGTLWVAPRGELRGSVVTDEVVVEGTCEGEVAARVRVELRPSARVAGRLEAPRLLVADGSVFDGEWRAGSSPRTSWDEPQSALTSEAPGTTAQPTTPS